MEKNQALFVDFWKKIPTFIVKVKKYGYYTNKVRN